MRMTLQEQIERDEQCKKLTLGQQIALMKRYGYEWPPAHHRAAAEEKPDHLRGFSFEAE